MSKKITTLILFLNVLTYAALPFKKGVNLTNWFQVNSANQIHFTKYTKQDFLNIKSLGCDVIRLPINLHSMTDGYPNYTLDNLFLFFLDQVIDWAEELNINLILDNHTFDPAKSTDPNIHLILIPVWKQMAEHFKNRSEYIYYEILNEPHGISNSIWNTIQLSAIRAIREVDSVHTIVVGPADWNSYNSLQNLPIYSDTNLIYTFHFYDPFIFTHQGASWSDPSMEKLSGIPFPYDANRMPEFPTSLVGTWIQSSFNNYINEGTVAKVKQLIDIADNFQKQRNVPIFCGEFGVYIPNSLNEDRVYWYEIVRKYFEEKNIAWTIWDYQGGFGIFEKGSNELFDYDLNLPLIKALGFTEVEQNELQILPDSNSVNFYIDYIENGISSSSWTPNGILNYYSQNSPSSGNFCIHWANAEQYNSIGFNFIPNRDFSFLAEENSEMVFSFYVKGDSPNSKFDIRFVDTKTNDPEDHPWRIKYLIDDFEGGPWDNTWREIRIPLYDFSEQGSWDNNQWFNPVGKFDWTAIDKFEIVAESEPLLNKNFWFDDIKIYNPNLVSVNTEKIITSISLEQNYPNPFNPITKIKYSIPDKTIAQYDNVKLIIFDTLGRELIKLVDDQMKPGSYEIEFDSSSINRRISSGIYLYRLIVGNYSISKKMIVLR